MPVQQEQTEILQREIEVIGDEAEAMRWMGNPIRALDNATPTSLVRDPKGYESVRVVLGRPELGNL